MFENRVEFISIDWHFCYQSTKLNRASKANCGNLMQSANSIKFYYNISFTDDIRRGFRQRSWSVPIRHTPNKNKSLKVIYHSIQDLTHMCGVECPMSVCGNDIANFAGFYCRLPAHFWNTRGCDIRSKAKFITKEPILAHSHIYIYYISNNDSESWITLNTASGSGERSSLARMLLYVGAYLRMRKISTKLSHT